MDSKVRRKFIPYQGLKNRSGISLHEAPEQLWDQFASRGLPFFFIPVADVDKPLDESALLRAIETWNESPDKKRLLDSLENLDKSIPIKKIAGFGVGTLSVVKGEDDGRQLHEHLAAFDVTRHLRKFYNQSEKIKVFFQDPIYSKDDKRWLLSYAKDHHEEDVEITIIDNAYDGLLEIDEATLVWAPGTPKFPVKQIVVDLTNPFNGPAAVMWMDDNWLPESEGPWTSEKAKKFYDPENWSNENEIKYYMGNHNFPLNRHVMNMPRDYNMEKILHISEWTETALWVKRSPK